MALGMQTKAVVATTLWDTRLQLGARPPFHYVGV